MLIFDNVLLSGGMLLCFACLKNQLIKMFFLSTHNICFGLEIKKKVTFNSC